MEIKTFDPNSYESSLATIYSMAYMYECRDEMSGEHLNKISSIAALVAKELAKNVKYQDYIDGEYVQTVQISSMLHDIGKLGIPESILNKRGQLNEEEFSEVKRHPVLGADKIDKLKNEFPGNPWYDMSECIIRYHHEHYDGKGYPDGLSRDQIPLSARIVAVADVYDALRSKRPYKPAFPHWRSAEIIVGGSGTHFDPDVVSAFLSAQTEISEIYDKANQFDPADL